jgi:hypothetical protein
MPICWKSPNHIDPSSTFTAFLVSVLVGARRFAHASLLRGDRALHALLGMNPDGAKPVLQSRDQEVDQRLISEFRFRSARRRSASV